jgi:hypothetical protein
MATKAGEILETARQLVDGDRARTHGDKVDNHVCIAELWNAYLRLQLRHAGVDIPGVIVDPIDVATMMILLKVARTVSGGEHNLDNYIDAAGYAAVAGEIAENWHAGRK